MKRRGYIPAAKLPEYLLSSSHPRGRGKARFFESLGFSLREAAVLEDALLAHLAENEPVSTQTGYGEKLESRGPLRAPGGRSAIVVSVWIADGADAYRLVTAFPGAKEA